MEIDLLFDPFGVRVDEALAGATAAERAGFGGVWLYDHLAGSVHGRDRVLECWTTLTAIAATVPRIMVGPLVPPVVTPRSPKPCDGGSPNDSTCSPN